MMTVTEIMAKLAYDDIVFPHEAVAEAVLQREAITPELLRILEDAPANIKDLAHREGYTGLIYALYLLAQFREQRAYQPLVELITADQVLVSQMLCDIVTEDLGRMLASVSHGDTSLIIRILENESLGDTTRIAAMTALVTLVAEGIIPREDVIFYFKSLFQGRLKRECSLIWCCLVAECCDLCAVEVAVEIERAFADGIVDEGFIDQDEVARYLSMNHTEAMEKLKTDHLHSFIDDTAEEMSKWNFYRTDQPSQTAQKEEPVYEPVPIRTGLKVGRNDPCPCGSGKKYKKCCG